MYTSCLNSVVLFILKKIEIVNNCIDNVFDMLDCFAYQSITKDTRVLEIKLI